MSKCARFMILYAWNAFEGGSSMLVYATEDIELVNLFAKLLLRETKYLVCRTLDWGYRSFIEETSTPRGRFLISESMKRVSIQRGRLICLVDELTPNLLHNQIIKATIDRLLAFGRLDRDLVGGFEGL